MPQRRPRDPLPRALSALAVLAAHGVAMALVMQAMAARAPAHPAEPAGGLLYLWPLPAPTAAAPPAAAPTAWRRAEPPAAAPLPGPGPLAQAPRAEPAPQVVANGPAPLAWVPAPSSAPTSAQAAGPATLAPAPASAPVTPEPPQAPRALAGNALPDYPEAAREDGLQGRVQLLLQIDAQGRVSGVQWLQRSGIALLDLAARDAARGWRYEPARRGGEAVPATLSVAIRFQLDAPVSATQLATR